MALAVVVSVPVVPPAHLNCEHQTAVRLPVPSWINRMVPDCPALMLEQVAVVMLPVSVTFVLKNPEKSKVVVVPYVVVVSVVNTMSAVNTLFAVPASKLLAVAPSIATEPVVVMVENDMPVPAATLVTVPPDDGLTHDVTPEPLVCST